MLSFGVRNYAHLAKYAFLIFGSLCRRYKTATGKVFYAEKPRPCSFSYGELNKLVAQFARTCRSIARI